MGWHRFFPLGYPVELVNTHESVIAAARLLWDRYPKMFDAPAVEFHDVDADQDLKALVLTELDRRYFAPIHAACVQLRDRGVVLMGDSGAGKSTLAYACVRAGWTLVSDDSSHIAPDLTLVASAQPQNLRPDVAQFFPELAGCPTITHANGKVALQVPEPVGRKLTSTVAACVFLHRGETTSLDRCDISEGLRYTGRYFPFPPESWHLERLAALFEGRLWTLTYANLDQAEARLRDLV
mgnify:FL=1